MGNRATLIPLNERTKAEALIIQKRGGRTKSIHRNEAQKFRQIKERMKRGGMKTADQEWLLAKLENRKSMAAELLIFIEDLKKDGVHPSQRIALGNLQKDSAKFIHGDKHINHNLNVNVDVEAELSLLDEHILKVLKN